jgi:hypothetical protein
MEIPLVIGLLIVVAVVAFLLGWHIKSVVMLANMAKTPDRMIQLMKEVKAINDAEAKGLPTEPSVEVVFELDASSSWLAYDLSGAFLGQGKSKDEALAVARRSYPDTLFWVDEEKE